ncbi:MAG: nucleotide exchange factor GrpE [Bacteroidota bacterium]
MSTTPINPDARDSVSQHIGTNTDAAEVALHAVDELAERQLQIEELNDENDRLVADLAAAQDQVKRKAAEFENYRRRTTAELGQAAARGRAEAVVRILDVYDDFRRSLQAATETAEKQSTDDPAFEGLREGVELVYRKFTGELEKLGVQPIMTVGEPFDERVHEALMQQPVDDPEIASGTILAEIQRGYALDGRVLRHARVVVAQ